MIKLNSLNSRLLIAFSGLSIIVCLFFIQLSVLLVEQTKENALYQLMIAEAHRLEKSYATTQKLNIVENPTIQIYRDEVALNALVPDKLTSLVTYNGALVHAEPYVILKHQVTPLMPIWLVVNKESLSKVTAVEDYMTLFLYSIASGVIFLALLSSWYLAKLLSSPIKNLTKDVLEKNQSTTHLIYGRIRNDEIGTLSRAFEHVFGELRKALKREQNFTRDVSHELRTPITLIKNTLSLNENKPIEKAQSNILQQASNELEQTVEVLLALARQENLAFEHCAFLPIIEKSILSIYNSYPQLAFDAKIKVDAKLEVFGNPYLISLLCQNLVNNGFYHGAGGKMIISSKNNSIIFENTIIKDKERPNYHGLGHGQYLVTRIVEEMNGTIEIEQSPTVYRVIISKIVQ